MNFNTSLIFSLVLCTCFLASNLNAQKIKVLSEDGYALPYATVLNRTLQKAWFTNEEGELVVPFSKGDTIEISFIGYKTIPTRFDPAHVGSYTLIKEVIRLENVTVRNCTKWMPYTINNLADSGGRSFGGVNFSLSTTEKAMVGVWIDTSFAGQRLNSIAFWLRIDTFLRRYIHVAKNAAKAPWRIWFYTADDSTFLPSELFTSRHIFWHPEDIGKQVLPIDTLGITVPANGLHVVFEYPRDDRFKYGKLSSNQGYRDSIDSFYGAIMNGYRGSKFPLVFFNMLEKKWSFSGNRQYNTFNKLFASIKFEIVAERCNE